MHRNRTDLLRGRTCNRRYSTAFSGAGKLGVDIFACFWGSNPSAWSEETFFAEQRTTKLTQAFYGYFRLQKAKMGIGADVITALMPIFY